MAQLIELPHVGESVVEGTIGKWLKQPGDRVERYDPLVEVVTDKVTMEVPSPVAGELLRIIAQEGETIPMGAPIAEVDTGDSAPAAAPATDTVATAPPPAAASTPMPAESAPAVPVAYLIDAQPVGPTGGSALEARAETAIDAAAPSAAVVSERDSGASVVQSDVSKPPNRLSPAVRRLAREHSIDVSRIAGTGIGGRVTRNDVLRYWKLRRPALPPLRFPVKLPPGQTRSGSR